MAKLVRSRPFSQKNNKFVTDTLFNSAFDGLGNCKSSFTAGLNTDRLPDLCKEVWPLQACFSDRDEFALARRPRALVSIKRSMLSKICIKHYQKVFFQNQNAFGRKKLYETINNKTKKPIGILR
ncbi:unnamed protein product [Trichobilharzia regenti]|nr:unnamed protein product [Trichobilharzia regenti]